MAVFGKRVTETTVLHEGDCLELLRALLADPKQSRRKRAEAAQAAKTMKNKPR
ncbi:MAG: RnfH family protein [Pseudomonadota bacterium]|nr:RnfH family protein [Pseudomonadota bacterium]